MMPTVGTTCIIAIVPVIVLARSCIEQVPELEGSEEQCQELFCCSCLVGLPTNPIVKANVPRVHREGLEGTHLNIVLFIF